MSSGVALPRETFVSSALGAVIAVGVVDSEAEGTHGAFRIEGASVLSAITLLSSRSALHDT